MSNALNAALATPIEESRDFGLFEDDRAGFIYRTAAKIIREKGFNATSMSEIADAVNLTKPGLYYYVKGKKELLYKITHLAMDLLERHVVSHAQEVADPAERLAVIIRRHAYLLTRDTGALAILIDEVDGLSPEQRAEIIGRKRSYFELVRRTLEELAEQGRLRQVDSTVGAFSLLGMVMWIARWYDGSGDLDGQQVADDVTRVALGILLDPPDGSAEKNPPSLQISPPSSNDRSRN